MEVNEIVEVLESLVVLTDGESVYKNFLGGAATEYHHERRVIRTVADNVTRSHIETVARRKFANLFLDTKAHVNHEQALVADRSGRKGGSGKSCGRESKGSNNGGTSDGGMDTSTESAEPSSRKERRTYFKCD